MMGHVAKLDMPNHVKKEEEQHEMRRITTALCALAMTLTLVACGGTTTPNSSGNPSTGDENKPTQTEDNAKPSGDQTDGDADYTDTEFRIAWWGGDERNTLTTELIELFEEQYPGLTIEVEYAGFGDYFTKLSTQAAGSTLPDVYMMDYGQISSYANSGQMEALDDYIASGQINLTHVDESMISGGRVNGTMYAIATGVNAPAIFFDPAITEEAGIDLPIDSTWDEFLDAARTIRDKTGQVLNMSWTGDTFGIYLRSLGLSYYNEDGSAFGFDEALLTEYLELIYDVIDEGLTLEPGAFDGDMLAILAEDTDVWALFDYPFSNMLPSYGTASDRTLHMISYPVPDGAKNNGQYLKPTMLWTIASSSANKDIAAHFIDFFINEPAVYDIAGTDRGIPISSEIRDYMEEKGMDEYSKIATEFINYLSDGRATEISDAAPAAASEAMTTFNDVIEQLNYRQLQREDLASVAKMILEDGNAILAEAAGK